MWLENAEHELIKAWIKNCPALKLVTDKDGKILWANNAFCEWSHYTLNELKRLTWRDISVPDKNLESDLDEVRILDTYNPSYTVLKQYQPKQSQPEWGQLTVMRYPLTGEIKTLLCTWDPLKNGTATAFSLAMESMNVVSRRIEEMTAEIKTVTTQTDEDRFVLGSIRMMQRHPKLMIAIFTLALSIFGLNNIVELLQRTGLVQAPVVVERSDNVNKSQ